MKELKDLFLFAACCCAFMYLAINTKGEQFKVESKDKITFDVKGIFFDHQSNSIVAPLDSVRNETLQKGI